MIKKRILCIALVGVLSFLLCACGDTDASAFEYEEKGDGDWGPYLLWLQQTDNDQYSEGFLCGVLGE